MDDYCIFALKEKDGCICKNSQHGCFKVGHRWDESFLLCDDVNYISNDNYTIEYQHYEYFLIPENYINCKKYYEKCDCEYCVYSKNKETNTYTECFCCKQKLYMKTTFHCSDCNSVLCKNCIMQGRYCDFEEGTFCYDCRRFGLHKNNKFYGYDGYKHPKDQWDFASFYY